MCRVCVDTSQGSSKRRRQYIRGQWDIGDTLKRYFKEHQAGDALVGRVLAGLDLYSPKFAALPPHFPKVSRRVALAGRALETPQAAGPAVPS